MGYFDALTSGTFKTTQDGRRLFFPWGTLGRGYVVESEADYEQLRQQVKSYLVVGMILIIGAMAGRAYVIGFAVTGVWCALYIAWTVWRLRSLQLSSERLNSREVMAVQARTHNPIFLWFAGIASLVFVAGGIFILVVNPRQWLVAGGAILFFGFCLVRFVQMISMRRQP